jgi:hypothetical protein
MYAQVAGFSHPMLSIPHAHRFVSGFLLLFSSLSSMAQY